jgi:nicotinamidase-related amidase
VEPYVTADSLKEKTQTWLKQIAPFNTHEMHLDITASALIVVDMQEFFLNPASPTFTCGGEAIIPNVQSLIAAFRKKGRPVIFTRHVHHPSGMDVGIMGWWWDGMCREGTPESEVHNALAPLQGEKQILKHRYSAFYDTDLETILRCQGVKDLVVSGIMTNMCCESTARDAYYRDYRVFFPADGTGSVIEEMHIASLLNLAFGFAHINTTADILADLA